MFAKSLLVRRQLLIGATSPARLTRIHLSIVASKPQLSIQSRSFFFKKKEKKLGFADRMVVKVQKSFSKIPTKYKFLAGALFVATFPGWVMWGIVEFVFEKIENIMYKDEK